MKKLFSLFMLLSSVFGYAQKTINNYKYVVIPQKFSFLKENDQYGLNSLSKMLLEGKGFTTYFDNGELPAEIANNKCNALTADLLEKNSMFTTNVSLILKDCQGSIIFKSKEGKSREKDFKTSYTLALTDAFSTLSPLKYEEKETIKQPEAQTATATTTVAAAAQPPVAKEAEGTLYAQPVINGYQLIDTAPKIVLTILKTSTPDYFIARNGTTNGLVLKKNDEWFFEYYRNNQLVAEKLLIKF